MSFELPKRGLVFWPVGTGDSTTIVVDEDIILQVDLNHLGCSEDDADAAWAIITELEERLPKRDGKPYLAVFALTHPDLDHCCGFKELLARVAIGELWFTPRIFREYPNELCDDAVAFRKEAKRRVQATIDAGGDPGAGDRVRVFGYSSLLSEEDYKGFPDDRLVVPGHALSRVDEEDVSSSFRAFVHAPFKNDADGERNDTSLGMQVTLFEGDVALRALLLGDLTYPTLKRIFDLSDAEDVAWNALLAPHHCSKSVMYWNEGEGEELKRDILEVLESAAQDPNYIVASSRPVPASNAPGDNPPHAKARKRYEEIVNDGFICTMEHPSTKAPEPVVFRIENGQVKLAGSVAKATPAAAAAKAARGSEEPPGGAVTYG